MLLTFFLVSGIYCIGFGAVGLAKIVSGQITKHVSFAVFFDSVVLSGGVLGLLIVKKKAAYVLRNRSWW
jgi:hypothetical protein